jgi:hypothetical protein
VSLTNIARVGVVAFLTLSDAGGRQVPPPEDLPPPKLLWSVSGLDLERFVELPLDPGVRVLFVDGVFIWLGGPMIALDEPTGRRLWERPFSPGHREALAMNRLVRATGDMLLLMEGTRLVKLDARSGAVREQYAVPSLPRRRVAYQMLAAGDRVALVEGDARMQWEWIYTLHGHSDEESAAAAADEGYVVAWTAGARAPVISKRPAGTSIFAMVGDVLLAASTDDGKLFALDLPRR